MWRAFAFAALTFALIAPASAQDGPRLLNTLDELTRRDAFPPVALARGVSGNVMLSCTVAADATAQCNVAEETPIGMGFGAAAQSLANRLQFAPVAGTVTAPVLFENQNTEALVIEDALMVEAGAHIDLSAATDQNYVQLMGTFHALAACAWSGRLDCATTDHRAARAFYNVGAYPVSARDAGVSARALVACAFRSGRRVDCAAEAASNTEHAFSEAAVTLVQAIATAQIDQFEAGQTIRVPVDFAIVASDGSRPSVWVDQRTSVSFGMPSPRTRAMWREGVRVVSVCTILQSGGFDCEPLGRPPQHFANLASELIAQRRLQQSALALPGYAIGDRIKVHHFFQMD